MRKISLLERMNYDPESGCWNWSETGRNNKGYGCCSFKGKPISANRLSAILWLGLSENDERHVLHRCDNPACFNPKHLFLGTHTDNMRDSVSKGRHWCSKKTHCPNGHQYSPENTYQRNGRRVCKACSAARWSEFYAANRRREIDRCVAFKKRKKEQVRWSKTA